MSKPMSKPTLPSASQSSSSSSMRTNKSIRSRKNRRNSATKDSSDVLISAVISPYLLTDLHHVLQRAEYRALKEGRSFQAENFAQLRKVLCMDARSMEDASAFGFKQGDLEKFHPSKIVQKVA